MGRLSIIDSLPEDEQQSLVRLATVLAGDAESGLQLLARSTLRASDRVEQIDAQDYPEESARRQLIWTYLAGRDRQGTDRVHNAVTALHYFCLLSVAETARVMDLPADRVEAELMAALTETDLFETWTPLLENPPDPAELAPAVRQRSRQLRRRRRRVGAMITVAVLVLAMSIVVPTVILPRLPHATHRAGVWSFVHTVELPEGWTVSGSFIDRTSETTFVIWPSTSSTTDDPNSCRVTLFAPDVGRREMGLDPDTVGGDAVRVAGRPGKFLTTSDTGTRPKLLWRYGSEAWALAECTAPPEDMQEILMQLARSVQYEPAQLKLPLRFQHLPADLTVESVGRFHDPETAYLELKGGDPDAWGALITSPALSTEPDPGTQTLPRDAKAIEISGQQWHYSATARLLCHQPDKPGEICILANRYAQSDASTGKKAARVRQLLIGVAESMELAPNTTDQSTWFDAVEALP